MKREVLTIEIYDKRERTTTAMVVEKLGDNIFRLVDGRSYRVGYGEVFKARVNKDGLYEIMTVFREDTFTKRAFIVEASYSPEALQLVADEVMREGGYLELQLDYLAVVRLPKGNTFDLVDAFERNKLYVKELV